MSYPVNSYSGSHIEVENVAAWLFNDDPLQPGFDHGEWAGATTEDPPMWSIARPVLSGQRYPSIEDLVERFEQDHADRQTERFLKLLDMPSDGQSASRQEMEDADQWAEGVRARLEALTQADLHLICKFSDAVARDDFEKIEKIVDEFGENAGHFGTLFAALGLTP